MDTNLVLKDARRKLEDAHFAHDQNYGDVPGTHTAEAIEKLFDISEDLIDLVEDLSTRLKNK